MALRRRRVAVAKHTNLLLERAIDLVVGLVVEYQFAAVGAPGHSQLADATVTGWPLCSIWHRYRIVIRRTSLRRQFGQYQGNGRLAAEVAISLWEALPMLERSQNGVRSRRRNRVTLHLDADHAADDGDREEVVLR